MSQIEALMLMALGFLLALMLVFVFGRSVWTASNLYARRAREKDMPAAMLALEAERDRLRADNARMSRKLEVGTEEMSAKVVTQMAEVSRHRDRVLTLSEQVGVADDELARTIADNNSLSAQVAELKRELDVQYKVINQLRQELAKFSGAKPKLQDVVMRPANENPPVIETNEIAPVLQPSPAGSDDSSPAAQAHSPAVARAMAANEKSGRNTRFNFDRRPLSPTMERTMNPQRQTELKDVIEEARRSLAAEANTSGGAKPQVPVDPVTGFAQRIREIQKKSDARLNKTLK